MPTTHSHTSCPPQVRARHMCIHSSSCLMQQELGACLPELPSLPPPCPPPATPHNMLLPPICQLAAPDHWVPACCYGSCSMPAGARDMTAAEAEDARAACLAAFDDRMACCAPGWRRAALRWHASAGCSPTRLATSARQTSSACSRRRGPPPSGWVWCGAGRRSTHRRRLPSGASWRLSWLPTSGWRRRWQRATEALR